MEKEFVPYQESLALKELGYDEPVEFFKDSSEEIFDMRTPNDAPCILWQQAFRWFREKHKLTGLIEIGTQEYSFIIFDEVTDSREITSCMNGTYEEAELACLIKLIEIVKQK